MFKVKWEWENLLKCEEEEIQRSKFQEVKKILKYPRDSFDLDLHIIFFITKIDILTSQHASLVTP